MQLCFFVCCWSCKQIQWKKQHKYSGYWYHTCTNWPGAVTRTSSASATVSKYIWLNPGWNNFESTNLVNTSGETLDSHAFWDMNTSFFGFWFKNTLETGNSWGDHLHHFRKERPENTKTRLNAGAVKFPWSHGWSVNSPKPPNFFQNLKTIFLGVKFPKNIRIGFPWDRHIYLLIDPIKINKSCM